ncbi:cobalt/nickel transport system permease protein [Caloramator quimbayensis]|uniref:Cobalt/nickel transport system permease protein n=1 Tax=Caloramator quimbayensis TaxID=1147123 RepID=A0A1T4WHE6_9CLOT|nr:cobalt transporter CbiM [Caloramator quimbayensis]SKA76378.1 cobalt/nickel transport system permease protein [Caloramator quimbayensis]
MHIPDNYLSPSTCAVFGAAMIPAWRRAVKKIKDEIPRKKMPMLGIGAAFSFLIMMFNLPLPGGTTGHAVGAVLVAILLGPYSACIAVTAALLVQALFFGDGGILAFGANCFNMAFIMPFSGYYIFSILKKYFKNEKGEYIASFIAGYIGLNIAAFFAAVEFGIQPALFKDAAGLPLYCPYPLSVSIPAMMIPHLLVAGVVEGLVTSLVYAYVKKVSLDTVYEGSVSYKPLYILIATMVILCPLGLLAQGTAWGEWGAEEVVSLLGYVPKGMEKGISFNSLMPDYTVSGLSETLGYIISAVAGIAIIFLIFKLVNMKSLKHEK